MNATLLLSPRRRNVAGEDIIMLRQRELKRLHVIRKVLEEQLPRGCSRVYLVNRAADPSYRHEDTGRGDEGIRHKSRGRPSQKATLQERIVQLYRSSYPDFGPTLFTEKLQEREGITVSRETVRTWLMEEGEWKKHRKRKAHRQWRERKDHYGEMLQMDAPIMTGLRAEAPTVSHGYIDDATGRVYGRFYDYEGTSCHGQLQGYITDTVSR